MIANDGVKYFYSYGLHLNYYLPIKEAPVVYVTKYDYEDHRGVYVYNTGETSITENNLDDIIYDIRTTGSYFIECIKKYEELEKEEDINFAEDGKEIYKEAISDVISRFEIQLHELEEALESASTEEDKNYILGSVDFTNKVIKKIKRLESLEPVIKL
jgi:predicted DNA-binding protein YlxM (UPF0122 family)